MNQKTRTIIFERAQFRCEYCMLHQDDDDYFPFHIEHIIPIQLNGNSELTNLCLSCSNCNWAKGPNIAGYLDGKLYPLFHPRKQSWERHFEWDQTILVGRTQIGRVTIQVLNINDDSRIKLRENLLFEGRFPK